LLASSKNKKRIANERMMLDYLPECVYAYPIFKPSKKPTKKLPMNGSREIKPTSHDNAPAAPPSQPQSEDN
jgi:hypothetical protein